MMRTAGFDSAHSDESSLFDARILMLLAVGELI
jgi:hypothetical protein